MSGQIQDYVERLQAEAGASIETARAAALAAARLHARAELMRHMRQTAAKVRERPREEAVEFVVAEWMKAWGLDNTAYPALGAEMRRFTDAICAGIDLEGALSRLDAAFNAESMDLGDQMAWRSTCAHRWWLMVNPAPAGVPAQSSVPALDQTKPIWATGCAEKCR